MTLTVDQCDVLYKWVLPDGLSDTAGVEAGGRRLVVSPRVLRVEHWPAHDSPGCLHVFIDGLRVRVDGTRGGAKGLGFSDEPDRWGETVQHTDDLPAWSQPYLDVVRAWEAARGNVRSPRLRPV